MDGSHAEFSYITQRKKKKKAELAALDSWTHINTALASARDAVSDPVLQTLLPPPTTCPPAIRLDGSDDEEVRRDLGDIPAGAMTFLFSRVKMNPEPEALLV